MFVCRSCVRKTLSSAAGETRLLGQPLRSSLAPASSHRSFATAPPAAKSESNDVESALAFAAQPAETVDLEAKRAKRLEFAVNKDLQYLKNNFKIAEHVLKKLGSGNFEEALLLTRKASRNQSVVVSWNHLIDFLMKQQRLSAAIKLYNEMKKRAQVPDAKTFTIIFRGCAASQHPKMAVAEAIKIYNSMLVGTVKPNTIHLNAVLETCGRAGDLDSLFTILKTMNEGLRAPNNQTFTIILNALRNRPDLQAGLDEETTARNHAQNIEKARLIWADAVNRWQKGRIVIDESLVCAMGRMLASGHDAQARDILPLLEQTMKVPRFDLTEGATVAGESQEEPQPTQVAKPVQYAKPGPNTLSLVLVCLKRIKKTSLATRYWQYFQTALGVSPDKDNYIKYLQVLQMARGSTAAANAIVAMPKEFLTPFSYRVAFSTCIHDSLNQHAFSNACKIFEVMARKSRYPDALSMRLFLQCARSNFRHLTEKYADDENAASQAIGKQIVTAIDLLWPSFRILMSSFSFSDRPTKSPEDLFDLSRGELQEAIATARRMIAAMDKVVQEKMADEEVCRVLQSRRVVLNKLVERHVAKEYAMDERTGKKLPASEQAGLDADLDRALRKASVY
ncbi:hypothetical protein QBC47DRAFT_393162 [Echria macrotheca]|uniref:Uncharacterized protein n=1 Tax=Echria macrotheca TaxID=438768 RepID=A0AAJ0B5P5_9PEZI|nr:hypothetical protein QBC47DRAFT_393162 [Echria macrotheca]